MPKIELEIDDPQTLVEILRQSEEYFIKKGSRTALERFDRTAKQLRFDVVKWQQKNEWYEFETPLGTFAVNRAGEVKVDGNAMAPGCHTIIMDVHTLVAKAFPNG